MELIQTLISSIAINIISCNNNINVGLYYLDEPKIEICEMENKKAMELIMLHELGHYYRFEYLTDKQKSNYEILFKNSKENDFFTNYSSTDVMEDFADNFSILYMDEFKIAIYKDGKYYKRKDIENKSKLLKAKIYYIGQILNNN